jgi:hypothetical protein
MPLAGRRKHFKVGDTLTIDLTDYPAPTLAENATYGLVRNFVNRGSPKWGTAPLADKTSKAVTPSNTLDQLKTVTQVTLNEVGRHTVMLVYFDIKGGIGRFIHLLTEEVQVLP